MSTPKEYAVFACDVLLVVPVPQEPPVSVVLSQNTFQLYAVPPAFSDIALVVNIVAVLFATPESVSLAV